MQPILSSSYLGFGHGSLSRDTDELARLMEYLVCHHSAENFALVGHSTGCQNSIHFLKCGRRDVVDRLKVRFSFGLDMMAFIMELSVHLTLLYGFYL